MCQNVNFRNHMYIYMNIAPSTPSINLSIHLSTFFFMHTNTHHWFINFEVRYMIQYLTYLGVPRAQTIKRCGRSKENNIDIVSYECQTLFGTCGKKKHSIYGSSLKRLPLQNRCSVSMLSAIHLPRTLIRS